MNRIAVVDFGTGNLRSVHKAIEHVSHTAEVVVTDEPTHIGQSDRVVFPGQGAIGTCIDALARTGLRDALLDAIERKPFLGICLGLQALYASSEEGGGTECLGVLAGEVQHFNHVDGMWNEFHDQASGLRLKIPHMGWNNVTQTRDHPLWRGIAQDERFYFVHSYCALGSDPDEVHGVCEYGRRFTAAGGRENVFAVQFHPEKSQHAGLTLLRNFVEWDGGV